MNNARLHCKPKMTRPGDVAHSKNHRFLLRQNVAFLFVIQLSPLPHSEWFGFQHIQSSIAHYRFPAVVNTPKRISPRVCVIVLQIHINYSKLLKMSYSRGKRSLKSDGMRSNLAQGCCHRAALWLNVTSPEQIIQPLTINPATTAALQAAG